MGSSRPRTLFPTRGGANFTTSCIYQKAIRVLRAVIFTIVRFIFHDWLSPRNGHYDVQSS